MDRLEKIKLTAVLLAAFIGTGLSIIGPGQPDQVYMITVGVAALLSAVVVKFVDKRMLKIKLTMYRILAEYELEREKTK